MGVFLLWLAALGAATLGMMGYQNTNGSAGATPKHWPDSIPIFLDRSRETLLMFAHPQCPCTRASLEELNRLMAQSGDRVAVHVLFLQPGTLPESWVQTPLARTAASIPGITVHDDLDGALARKFGAETSGYVVLYGRDGSLLFHGGITAGRGHAGDNSGETSILSLLAGKNTSFTQTPVYGCALMNESGLAGEVAR